MRDLVPISQNKRCYNVTQWRIQTLDSGCFRDAQIGKGGFPSSKCWQSTLFWRHFREWRDVCVCFQKHPWMVWIFFFLRFKTESLVQNQTSLCMNVCLCTRGIRCVIHCVSTSAKIRKPRGILETMLTGISTTTSDEWLWWHKEGVIKRKCLNNSELHMGHLNVFSY